MNLKNKIITSVLCASLTGIGIYKLTQKIENTVLSEKDFIKAKWGLYENSDGKLWQEYMNEKTHKSSWNWGSYIFYTQLINKGNLEGNILLPDLDENDSIGKQKPKEWKSGKELFNNIKNDN
jgi:hypothetical protein